MTSKWWVTAENVTENGMYGQQGILYNPTIWHAFKGTLFLAVMCALIAGTPHRDKTNHFRVVLGSVIGALSYVALYMLKTYIYQRYVYGNPLDGVWAAMLGKLPASMINAVFAMIVAPLLYAALIPPLKRANLLEKLGASQ